jgi:hypothetical protein
MAEKKTSFIEGNCTFLGDSNTIDGTLAVTGALSCTTTFTIAGASGTFGGSNIVITADCANTTAAGLAWTSGVPVFSAGQAYITVKAGATTFRIPVWFNA